MEEYKAKINELRSRYVDDDSKLFLDDIERDISVLFDESKLKDHPVFEKITADAEKKLNDLNALLMNDRTLSDSERAGLFRAKEIWHFIFRRFSMTPHDEALRALDETLDHRLSQSHD